MTKSILFNQIIKLNKLYLNGMVSDKDLLFLRGKILEYMKRAF